MRRKKIEIYFHLNNKVLKGDGYVTVVTVENKDFILIYAF